MIEWVGDICVRGKLSFEKDLGYLFVTKDLSYSLTVIYVQGKYLSNPITNKNDNILKTESQEIRYLNIWFIIL